MRVFRKKVFRLLPFILGLIFALVVVLQNGAILATSTEILWDTYGVPHIFGKDTQSAFRGEMSNRTESYAKAESARDIWYKCR